MFTARRTVLSSSFRTRSVSSRFILQPRILPFKMVSTLPQLPIFKAIASHNPKTVAVVHSVSGRTFTYGQLLGDVAFAKDNLINLSGETSLNGERVAFFLQNGYDYVVALLSCLAAHSIALPLSPAFPANELKYILDQSQAAILISSTKFEKKAEEVLKQKLEKPPRHIKLKKNPEDGAHTSVNLEGSEEGEGGMMLYTSGTTNRPKGVLLPQSVLTAQSLSLNKAWNYSSSDRLLHVLPLHHIHGTVNAVLAPLFAGSSIEFLFPFNATSVWERFAAPFLPTPRPNTEAITFFTVVPTVYNRLLSTFPSLEAETQNAAKIGISPRNLRLNISGSAALPTHTKIAWNDLSSGNVLLERYGMTEAGMALSCGLPFTSRIDGSVGWPLPSVEVRLVDTETGEVIREGEELGEDGRERDGEIQLRGPTVFKEYWRNKEATTKEHVPCEDGKGWWFKTGDVAVRRNVPSVQTSSDTASSQEWATGPMYFIRGRISADIIKSGGEKVSALEVERELLCLPEIEEAAVVAVPSGKWGQKVGVVIILKKGAEGKRGPWGPMDMRRALKERLAAYKIPQLMKVVDEIPRNAMGKINKKVLVKEVFMDEASDDEM